MTMIVNGKRVEDDFWRKRERGCGRGSYIGVGDLYRVKYATLRDDGSIEEHLAYPRAASEDDAVNRVMMRTLPTFHHIVDVRRA